MEDCIVFFDSGIGGLSTLSEIIRVLPSNYVYFADNKNCPYGNLSRESIINNLTAIILKLKESHSIKVFVLACNTATTSAIESLRVLFPEILFVGTEPAVMLARKRGYSKICAITTPTTASQEKYKKLESLAGVFTIAEPKLACLIEKFMISKAEAYKKLLEEIIDNINARSRAYDCLVLGCTHYCLIKDMFSAACKKPIIDGNMGVARRVVSLIKQNGLESGLNKNLKIKFMFSTPQPHLEEKYEKILEQILANDVKV